MSHDGSRIAMVMVGTDERTDIVRASDGSTARLAVPAGTVAMGSPSSWSPDDQRIAFLTFDGTARAPGGREGGRLRLHRAGRRSRSTSSFGLWSSRPGRPTASGSPSSPRIAPRELGDIYLIRPDGKDLHKLTTSPVSAGGGVSWSPDPTVPRLLYTAASPTAGAPGSARTFDVTSARDLPVAPSFWPTWSPDGDSDLLLGHRGAADGRRPGRPGPTGHRHHGMGGWQELPGAPRAEGQELLRTGRVLARRQAPHRPGRHGTSILSVMADGTGQPIVIPLDTNVLDLGNPVVWLPVR